MATNQNGSFLNFFKLGFGDEAIDNGPSLSLRSNFSLSHVNGSDLINSQLPLSDPIASTEFHHQNGLISQNTYPCIMWNKLRVRGFTNYEFSLENQLPLPSYHVTSFSEAQRNTQFLSWNSTMYRLLAPNHNIPNQTFHVSNKAIHRLSENEPFSYHYLSQPIITKTPTTINNDHHVERGVIFTHTQMNVVCAPQIKSECLDLDLNSHHNPSRSFDNSGIINLQTSNIGEPGRNLVGSVVNQTTPLADIGNSFDNDDRYDGRIHSVRGENRSYKCPKCHGVFNSPHKFSSHMRIHYKGESNAQKKRRFAARHKGKTKLHLVYSSEGLTAIPCPLGP